MVIISYDDGSMNDCIVHGQWAWSPSELTTKLFIMHVCTFGMQQIMKGATTYSTTNFVSLSLDDDDDDKII